MTLPNAAIMHFGAGSSSSLLSNTNDGPSCQDDDEGPTTHDRSSPRQLTLLATDKPSTSLSSAPQQTSITENSTSTSIDQKPTSSTEAATASPTNDGPSSLAAPTTIPPPPPPPLGKRKRREICTRCHRPTPRACICHALPHEDQPLVLKDTQVIILQHPHEFRHKNNRSVPLLDLCFQPPSAPNSNGNSSNGGDDEEDEETMHNKSSPPMSEKSPLHLCVGRRFGDQIPPAIWDLVQPPNLPILIFPETKDEEDEAEQECRLPVGDDSDNTGARRGRRPQVHTLSEILPIIREWRQQQQQQQQQPSKESKHNNPSTSNDNTPTTTIDEKNHTRNKVVLLVLDATWKFAKEMHRANVQRGQYPPHMLRMTLNRDDLPTDFQPSRFEIRATPQQVSGGYGSTTTTTANAATTTTTETTTTSAWMCTAECVAWILSQLEQTAQPQNSIYETVLRAIDAAVEKHNSFLRENQEKNRGRKKTKKKQVADTNKKDKQATNKGSDATV